MGINTVTLQELCKCIVDCEHKTAPKQSSGIPSIRTTDIKNGRLDLENSNRVSYQTFLEWSQRETPLPGDILLAREAPVGEVGIIPPRTKVCQGQRTVLIRTDENRIHNRYLLYLLLSRPMKHEMLVRAEGSTVPHLNMSDIRKLEIPIIHTLPEQRAIAHILGTLDDKIELNRKMNETLEGIARALFKSWFVDFDPVRAKRDGRRPAGMDDETAELFPDELVLNDELGKEVPEGWEIGKISDFANVTSGKRPQRRSKEKKDEYMFPLYGGGGIMAYVADSMFSVPFLLTGRVGTLGKIFLIAEKCWPSDNTLLLLPTSKVYLEFLNFFLLRIDFSSLNRGSTQPLITQTDLKNQKIVRPPLKIIDLFYKYVHPLFTKLNDNKKKSRTLTSIRDTLLPKLISGQVRIGDSHRFLHKRKLEAYVS